METTGNQKAETIIIGLTLFRKYEISDLGCTAGRQEEKDKIWVEIQYPPSNPDWEVLEKIGWMPRYEWAEREWMFYTID